LEPSNSRSMMEKQVAEVAWYGMNNPVFVSYIFYVIVSFGFKINQLPTSDEKAKEGSEGGTPEPTSDEKAKADSKGETPEPDEKAKASSKGETPEPDEGEAPEPKPSAEDLERMKRNHTYDLKNVLAFFLVGLAFVVSGPSTLMASRHFKAFFVSQVFLAGAYRWKCTQLYCDLGALVGTLVIISMAVQILLTSGLV